MDKSKKGASGKPRQKTYADDFIFKLLQLNLDRAMAYAFKLQKLFFDLRQKYEGEYIFGKQYVAETAIDANETLDKIYFHLNSISRGNDIDVLFKLDKLKAKINASFDTKHEENPGEIRAQNGSAYDDELSTMLAEVIQSTSRISLTDKPFAEITLEDCRTSIDMLIYGYRRMFDLLQNSLMPIVADNGQQLAKVGLVALIPTHDRKSNTNTDISATRYPEAFFANPAARSLADGINELFYPVGQMAGDKTAPVHTNSSTVSPADDLLCALIYSLECLTLYFSSSRYDNILTANVCDAAEGNHLYVLSRPHFNDQGAVSANMLVNKILNCLDFHTFSNFNITIASLKNMTRNDMENHLNMVGKMLSFISYAGISADDDKAIQRNLETFLELVV